MVDTWVSEGEQVPDYGPAWRPGLNTYICAEATFNLMQAVVLGQADPRVPYRRALELLGMNTRQLNKAKRKYPELVDALPVGHVMGEGSHILVFDIWEQVQWVLFGDAARSFDVSQGTLDRWARREDMIRTARRPFRRNAICCLFEDLVTMRLRLKVKSLIGHRVMPWEEIHAWMAMGKDAVTLEAARQAVAESGEVEFEY